MAAKKSYDYLYKLLLIGDSCCGKTRILFEWAEDTHDSVFISTVGIDFKIRTDVIGGKRIKSQIWDTAGQERFRTINTSYYRGAQGIFIVFDSTNRSTFDNASLWLDEVAKHTEEDKTTVMILANEFRDETVQVSPDELTALAQRGKAALFMHVSTLRNHNLEDAFLTMLEAVHEKNRENLAAEQADNDNKCALQ